MSEIKVERRHREAAWAQLRPVEHSEASKRWLETGESMGGKDLLQGALTKWSKLAAEFEARGYAACQADVVAWLGKLADWAEAERRRVGGRFPDAVTSIREHFQPGIARGEHVGASKGTVNV